MRLLFINISGFLPQVLGGVETTTYQLCLQLSRMGHDTAVWHHLEKRDLLWLHSRLKGRLMRTRFPRGRCGRLTVYRGYFGSEFGEPHRELVRRVAPDRIVVSGGTDGTVALAAEIRSSGLPVAHYFHDIMSLRHDLEAMAPAQTLPPLDGVTFLSNSHYTAEKTHDLIGVTSTVITPFVDQELYRTPAAAHQYVTMVNPRKIKGGDTALGLARACPDIPFLFVEAWSSGDPFVAELREAVRTLPNVTWQKATPDMRGIYAKTKLLLVPSRWEETWGRVVSEAHVSGIPVLASKIAGLPESVGPGGVLVEPDAPLDAWRTALQQIWNDPARHRQLSQAARDYSLRADAQPDVAAARFLSAIGA